MKMKHTIILGTLVTSLFVTKCKTVHKTGAGNAIALQAAEIKKRIPDFEVTQSADGIRLGLNSDVLFEFDRFDLQDRFKHDLDHLAAIFQRYPDTHVDIQGYTDNTGSESHNLALSDNRARAVQKYLEVQGVTPGRMTAKGYGAASPKASNETEAGRALNRRVEFFIR
jgi:outer membrane protein OmpA-like peptidoglycan-associated protein